MPASRPPSGPSLVVAVDGLDTAGTAEGAELIGRWLERKGWRVRFHASDPSSLVRSAARNPRTRRALTPAVAALLTAADATRRIREIAGGLRDDAAFVIDRYAWTAAARDAARGVDLAWAARLYASCPRPDLVVLVDRAPDDALRAALAVRGSARVEAAAAAAFGTFLGGVAAGFDALALGAPDAVPGPWPTRAVRVPFALGPDGVLAAARRELRPLAAAGPPRQARP